MKPTRVNNMTFTRKGSRAKIDRILQVCRHGRTRQELEIILALTRRTTLSYLVFLHETGQLHISSWKREGIGQFYPVPVYTTGPGVDALKPEPLSETEKQKRSWAKLKADPVRYAQHRARKAKRPPKPSAGTVFDWRGKSSTITSSSSWRASVNATRQMAGKAGPSITITPRA